MNYGEEREPLHLTSHPGQLSLAIPLGMQNEYYQMGGDAVWLESYGLYNASHLNTLDVMFTMTRYTNIRIHILYLLF